MDIARFELRLSRLENTEWKQSRIISLFAASIALADTKGIDNALVLARSNDVARDKLYETILQSYLFLGFPRMLIASGQLDKIWPTDQPAEINTVPISPKESQAWFDNGLTLCKKIYGQSFEPLKQRVERIAPEVFRWMIIEGYGKVLSRNGLGLIDRELCIVTSLIIENRRDQLHSHLRGALNAGASKELIEIVIEDLGESVGRGYQTANQLLSQTGLVQ